MAWRRTGLALIVGALTIGRLTMSTLGIAVFVPAAVAVALAAWVVATSLRRGRYASTHPGEPAFTDLLHDGKVPAVVALVTCSLALGELLSAGVQLLGG